MLASINPSLGDRIVTLLAHAGSLDAESLREKIGVEGRKYTIQAIYYELRKLQKVGVIIKHRANYSLSLTWALQFMKIADSLHNACISAPIASEVIPEPHNSVSWKFSNLLGMDDFWVQTMRILLQHSGCRTLYNWAPHPWFYFAQAKKLDQFYQSLIAEKKRFALVIGGTSFLDQLFAEQMSPELYDISLDPDFFLQKKRQHIMIIGDYVLSVTIDKRMMNDINEIFESTRSSQDLDIRRVYHALNNTTTARFRVEHNPKKASRIRNKFVRYFG